MADEPEAKRHRTTADDPLVQLPATVWALALDYLVYEDVRACTLMQRSFLRDVVPNFQVLS